MFQNRNYKKKYPINNQMVNEAKTEIIVRKKLEKLQERFETEHGKGSIIIEEKKSDNPNDSTRKCKAHSVAFN